jgi:hypothetical protein
VAFTVGGHSFEQPPIKLIRIIPTLDKADLAYCTPDLLAYSQEWTPLGHQRWLRDRAARLLEDKDGEGV